MATYYTVSGAPITQSRGASKPMRDEFSLIAAGFNSVDAAIALLAPKASPTFTGTVVLPAATSIGNVSATELSYLDGVTSALQGQIDLKASLASPTLTGVPLAPTAAPGTNTTQIATTAFVVATSFSSVLPAQSGNAGKYVTTDGANASWADPFANAALTGNPTAPTPSPGDADTSIATTAFVDTSFAKKASPTLIGIPVAPTAAAGTNTTQIATTEFVTGAVGGYVADAVGTYAFAYSISVVAFGSAVPGSGLQPAGVTNVPALTFTGGLSGTWRCLGNAASNTATLFLRIS